MRFNTLSNKAWECCLNIQILCKLLLTGSNQIINDWIGSEVWSYDSDILYYYPCIEVFTLSGSEGGRTHFSKIDVDNRILSTSDISGIPRDYLLIPHTADAISDQYRIVSLWCEARDSGFRNFQIIWKHAVNAHAGMSSKVERDCIQINYMSGSASLNWKKNQLTQNGNRFSVELSCRRSEYTTF